MQFYAHFRTIVFTFPIFFLQYYSYILFCFVISLVQSPSTDNYVVIACLFVCLLLPTMYYYNWINARKMFNNRRARLREEL